MGIPGRVLGFWEVLEFLRGSKSSCWDPSLWTHPPARRQPDAWGHKDSCPCHPLAFEGPAGARVPGGGETVPARPFLTLPTTLSACIWPYLQPVAHLHKRTGWVEGPCATGQQVGVVVCMQQLHEVHAFGLVGGRGGDSEASPREVTLKGPISSMSPPPLPFFCISLGKYQHWLQGPGCRW